MNSRRLTLHENEDPELHLWGDVGAAQDAWKTGSQQAGKPKLNNQKAGTGLPFQTTFSASPHTSPLTLRSLRRSRLAPRTTLCITLLQSDVLHRINNLVVRPSASSRTCVALQACKFRPSPESPHRSHTEYLAACSSSGNGTRIPNWVSKLPAHPGSCATRDVSKRTVTRK